MDHMKVLKRAWHILWQYRILWVFGIILALTTASASSGSSASSSGGSSTNNGRQEPEQVQPFDSDSFSFQKDFKEGMEDFGREAAETIKAYKGFIITFIILTACFLFLLIAVSITLRYVSEVSLIRMVDDYEETEVKRTFAEGWRMGWSPAAWRLFFIDLLLFLVIFPGFVLLILVAALPAIITVTIGRGVAVFGIITSVGLGFLLIFLGIIVVVALSMLIKFFRRTCVLEDLTVMESFQRGFAFVRQNLKDVGLMWLIMLGVKLVTPLVMLPLIVAALGLGGLMSGILGLVAWRITTLLASSSEAAIFVGVFIGLPILILLVAAPIIFVYGLQKTYISTSWTLTYREINALGGLDNAEALPEPGEPTPQPA